MIFSCFHLCYMHGSDFIDLCLTNIILVLSIFVDSFYACVYIYCALSAECTPDRAHSA